MPIKPVLTVSFEGVRWKKKAASIRPRIRRAVLAALAQEKVKGSVSVTIICTGDKRMCELNHDYRGKDKPTNVLSFTDRTKDGGVLHLGDIILSLETVAREAKAQGKAFSDHLMHLTVHGVLHLLGEDHEKNAAAQRMESKEIFVLQALGIKNPYR